MLKSVEKKRNHQVESEREGMARAFDYYSFCMSGDPHFWSFSTSVVAEGGGLAFPLLQSDSPPSLLPSTVSQDPSKH